MDKDNTVAAVFKYLHSLFVMQVMQYYIYFNNAIHGFFYTKLYIFCI